MSVSVPVSVSSDIFKDILLLSIVKQSQISDYQQKMIISFIKKIHHAIMTSYIMQSACSMQSIKIRCAVPAVNQSACHVILEEKRERASTYTDAWANSRVQT